MIGYRYNDGGRKEAGYKGHTGDCVVRAMAIVSGRPYLKVYDFVGQGMKAAGFARSGNAYTAKYKKGKGSPKAAQNKVKQAFGFQKIKQPKGKKLTYSQAHEKYGNCIVSSTRHVCAIVDGKLQDTFDGRGYWWVEAVKTKVEAEDCAVMSHVWNVAKQVYDVMTHYPDFKERKAMSIWVYKYVNN